jgi:hypothetical protein
MNNFVDKRAQKVQFFPGTAASNAGSGQRSAIYAGLSLLPSTICGSIRVAKSWVCFEGFLSLQPVFHRPANAAPLQES